MQIQYKYKYKYKQSNPITSDPPPHLYNEVTLEERNSYDDDYDHKDKEETHQNMNINGDNYCIPITKE